MYDDFEKVVNNEYDYSNMIPSAEGIAYLIQYCEKLYMQFNDLVIRDEQKNQTIKYDYKTYEYHKHFKSEFTVTIKQKGLNNIICKSHSAFLDAVSGGKVKNLNGLDVIMDLSYKRGNVSQLQEHRNDFKVIFRPYDIKFIRKSNHQESDMDKIENSINAILSQFPIANSIFCTK